MKKSGFKATKAMLNKITPAVKAKLTEANRDNAEMIVDLAKVLIPAPTGENRAKIHNKELSDGAQLVDFGPKAKVIEGKSGPRPFVNPALKSTRQKRNARNRKAVKDALKAIK